MINQPSEALKSYNASYKTINKPKNTQSHNTERHLAVIMIKKRKSADISQRKVNAMNKINRSEKKVAE